MISLTAGMADDELEWRRHFLQVQADIGRMCDGIKASLEQQQQQQDRPDQQPQQQQQANLVLVVADVHQVPDELEPVVDMEVDPPQPGPLQGPATKRRHLVSYHPLSFHLILSWWSILC